MNLLWNKKEERKPSSSLSSNSKPNLILIIPMKKINLISLTKMKRFSVNSSKATLMKLKIHMAWLQSPLKTEKGCPVETSFLCSWLIQLILWDLFLMVVQIYTQISLTCYNGQQEKLKSNLPFGSFHFSRKE